MEFELNYGKVLTEISNYLDKKYDYYQINNIKFKDLNIEGNTREDFIEVEISYMTHRGNQLDYLETFGFNEDNNLIDEFGYEI